MLASVRTESQACTPLLEEGLRNRGGRRRTAPRLLAKTFTRKKADTKVGKGQEEESGHGETGQVGKQNPKRGNVLAPGFEVGVKLGGRSGRRPSQPRSPVP